METNPKRTRRKRSQTERDELVAAWRVSGQKVPEFGAEHGVPNSTLYQWIRRRGPEGGVHRGSKRTAPAAPKGRGRAKASTEPRAGFTEVQIVGQLGKRDSSITIALENGRSVTVDGGLVDPAWLGSVLEVVARC